MSEITDKYLTEQKVRGKLKPRVSAKLLESSVKKAEDNIFSNLKTLTATADILREHGLDVTKLTPRAKVHFGDVDFALTQGTNILRGVIKSIKSK